MTKTEKLKKAYADLKEGKIIEFIQDEDKKVPVKTGCRCKIIESNNSRKHFIGWWFFGQSANEMSLNDLRWIAKVIANCTTYDYKIVNSIYGD